MLKKIKITQDFIKKERILDGTFKGDFELNFQKGINVLTAPNGAGKTTIMNCINDTIIDKKVVRGFSFETTYEKDDQPKNWFFFSMKDMTAKEQLSQVSPFDQQNYAGRFILWANRLYLSHGQQMKEVLLDIKELAEVSDVILIDEPETALDLLSIVEFIEVLTNIHDTQIILISHHPLMVFNEQFNIIEFSKSNHSYLDSLKKKIKKIKLTI
jgi:ABC-type multidrug transport system ATPase subunit